MSSDERSPKRQRLSSYSPASTPTETKSTPFVQHPNTPPPSVHMSPSWQSSSQLPGLGMVGGNNGNGGGVNFPTPPSPAAGYHSQSQSMAQSVGSEGGSARQTPAAESSERADTEMQEGAMGSGDGDVSMAEDDEHRRTDHERTEDEDAVPPLPSAVGLYKLPAEPIQRSQPHVSQNLLQMYNLTAIQSSVARKDPLTGAKINKLRKSYEGKVKDLGLEGRNKASQNKLELENLLDPEWDLIVPDDGRSWWDAHQGEKVEFSERGAEGMLGLLDSALSLKPGKLPKAEDATWKNLLGLDDSTLAKTSSTATVPAKTPASQFLAKASPAGAVQRSAPASPRGTGRPERSGKKRRYDDASWEGYDEDGYSTGDGGGGRGSAAKRQKRKDFPPSSTSPPYTSSNAGGSNMVGVRSS